MKLRHYKIVVSLGSITNRGSNNFPHDCHHILTITLKNGFTKEGEKWDQNIEVILEGNTIHSLVFFDFPANFWMNPDVL